MPGDPSPPVKRMVFLIVVATIFAGYGTAYLASDDVRFVTPRGARGDQHPAEPRTHRRAGGRPDHGPGRTPRPAAGPAEPGLRRLAGSGGEGDLHELLGCRSGYAPAGAPGGAEGLHLPLHLEVPHRWTDPVQGVLRFRRGAEGGRPARSPGIRRVSPPLGGLLHPRMVQRPAPVHRAYPRLGGAGGDRVSRDRAQHAVREERHPVQRELRPVRGLSLGRILLRRALATRRTPDRPRTG